MVASTPLKNRLVLVVRVPLTEGEMLPVPFVRTGGRSALTPASADSRCVKLPVEVGGLKLGGGQLRKVVAVVAARSPASETTCTVSLSPPTAS